MPLPTQNKEVQGMTTNYTPSVSSLPSSPTIDGAQALWATRELATMIEQLGLDSPVAMVLRQARREIISLTTSSMPDGIVGPIRDAA